jgi:hypothetical protein
VDLGKSINKENFKELEEKFKISYMKVNLKITCLMDGVDILIIKAFIGDSGLMDLEMAEENGCQPTEKQKRETGQWVL